MTALKIRSVKVPSVSQTNKFEVPCYFFLENITKLNHNRRIGPTDSRIKILRYFQNYWRFDNVHTYRVSV